MESSQFDTQWDWNEENAEDELELPTLPPPSAQKTTDKINVEKEKISDDNDDDQWEYATSEIASIGTEELHETRPNRFRGKPPTWRRWTKADRDAWASIEGVRMSDLGVHLYNAFALRRDARAEARAKRKDKGKGKANLTEGEESVAPRSGQKELVDDEDAEDPDMDSAGSGSEVEKPWEPPKEWTAWPNYERGYERRRNGNLMAGIGERFPGETIKRGKDPGVDIITRNLEEEISAGILRAAKEKFYERLALRKKHEEEGETVEDGDEEEQEEIIESVEAEAPGKRPASRARSRSLSTRRALSEVSDMGYTSGEESRAPSGKRKRSPSYEPILMADDDLAYEMVRPATLQIMEKLDATLMMLHHYRAENSGVTLPGDIATDTEGPGTNRESTAEQSPPQTPRKMGRPRKDTSAVYEKPRSTSRGRPRKIHTPLEGETEEEMHIRIARQQKRRMPDSYFDSSDRATSRSKSRGRSTGRKGTERPERSESQSSRATSVDSTGSTLSIHQRKRLMKKPLRNWRDIIAAAALAGFEPEVIERAKERCAALFGQDMTTDTVYDAPATDTPEDDLQDRGTRQSSSISFKTEEARASSTAPNTAQSTPAKRPKVVGGPHKCPQADCPMALKGFGRYWNLKRHVENQHPGVPVPGNVSRASSVVSMKSETSAVSSAPLDDSD
ncbi:hypothetical protein V8F20_012844 [Naviculisporaceae sp. PSN 640]